MKLFEEYYICVNQMYYCGKINVLMFNCNFVGIVYMVN